MAEGLLAGTAFVDLIPRFKNFAKDAEAEVQKAASGMESKFQSIAGVGKAAFVGILGGAAAVGAASIELADKFEAAQARLENALHNSGSSLAAQKTNVDFLNRSLEKLGFANAETETGLAKLVPVTKNVNQAMDLMSLAADVARGRHISLESATDLLVKVQTGHVALLGRLGIATKDANGHTISQEEAVRRLSELYGGNAQRYANTFAGKMTVLKTEAEDLGKNIGLKLIPVIEKVVSITANVVTWFEKHRSVAVALGVAIGTVLVVAVTAYAVSMATAAVATIAATAPILAIIAAVALVGVGIFELATHWHQVWSDIKQWIADAFNWIKQHTTLIIALFGPVGVAVELLAYNWKTIWHDIQTVVQDVWKVLQPIFHAIEQAAKDIAGPIGAVVGAAAKVGGFIGKHLGFDQGGWVPGPLGAPVPAVVHGGEYVLSRDMLAGKTATPFAAPSVRSGGGSVPAAQSVAPHQHPIYFGSDLVTRSVSRGMDRRQMAYK